MDEREALLAVLAPHIRDPRVLAAMAAVPREAFVPEKLRAHAWENTSLPIEEGQTISQPVVVARMCELLELRAPRRCSTSARARATTPPCWRSSRGAW